MHSEMFGIGVEEERMYRIGIDLGGTNIKIGIVNEDNKIVARTSIPTSAERPYQQVLEDMGLTALRLLEENGIPLEYCDSVGVGCPGIADAEKGIVIYSNNIAWTDVPVAEELQKYFGTKIPVYISNDANCAALGEVMAGAAKGCQNAVMITLGTGVGSGIVIDGKIFEGGHFGGAECGHTVIVPDGELCSCGRRGCFETYASATALIRETRRVMQTDAEMSSVLWKMCNGDLNKVDGRMAFEAMKLEDVSATAVVESYIKYLSIGITNLVNIFRPDVVLLGGGVCNQGEVLTRPINEYVRANCFGRERTFVPEVKVAELGNDAGIIGAAGLGRE